MHASPQRPTGKKVMLMATCLCDAFYDDVAKATVEVLEYLGCEVLFPEDQTCCGQPAFNSGDWKASRKVLRHTADVFAGDLPVLVPSGSCAAMLFHGASLAFEKESDPHEFEPLAGRAWELCDFIVNGLGVTEWTGAKYPYKVSFHHSCHTRGTGSGAAATKLLESIEGLKILPFGETEQCCGFGGTFSVSFPTVSSAMGTLKLDHLLEGKPDFVISGDMSCLMHLGGLGEKAGNRFPIRHVVQILRDSLPALNP